MTHLPNAVDPINVTPDEARHAAFVTALLAVAITNQDDDAARAACDLAEELAIELSVGQLEWAKQAASTIAEMLQDVSVEFELRAA